MSMNNLLLLPKTKETLSKSHSIWNRKNCSFSSSFLSVNNVSLNYRFEKMKLSEIFSRLILNKDTKKRNLFESISNIKGAHMDKDIKNSQEILQLIKRKRVIQKDEHFDIGSLLCSKRLSYKDKDKGKDNSDNSYDAHCISNKQKFVTRNKFPIKIIQHPISVIRPKIQNNGSSKNGLQSYDDIYLKDNNKTHKSRNEPIIRNKSSRHINNNQMLFNENCLKMRNNLQKEQTVLSTLKLNKNYQVLQGKDGVKFVLENYLTSKEQGSYPNESLNHEQSRSLELSNNDTKAQSKSNTRNHSKNRTKVKSSFFQLNPSLIKEPYSERNRSKVINNRLLPNDDRKSILEAYNLQLLKNINQAQRLKAKKQSDINIKQQMNKMYDRTFYFADQIRNEIDLYHNSFCKKVENEYDVVK